MRSPAYLKLFRGQMPIVSTCSVAVVVLHVDKQHSCLFGVSTDLAQFGLRLEACHGCSFPHK